MTHDTAAHWARVDALLAQAMALEPGQRNSFLSRSSGGDPQVETEVLELLASLERAEAAIGESADALLAISGPLVDRAETALDPGTRLGTYEIRGELGRGGMGTVYLAARTGGDFERDVAIKVMRSAHDSQTLLRRFAAERQILGSLEHPRIARLYDSGLTLDGRPYLVMERVQGLRIDHWADAHARPVTQRLALFDAVCDAVIFAHQRLVVHRDLKPANVLVSEDGHVSLLDFGIARLLDADPADPATRPGHLVLTPEYASPEQARAEAPDIGMDVYALGVMLHELLAGVRPPWQRMVVARADVAAIESAMVPPSRSTSNPDSARALRGDLDTVILTALAPERDNRYASVQALREDLRRVREGFPIMARTPTWRHRAVKFSRRNPVATSAGVLLLVLASVSIVTTRMQSRRIADERDRANVQRLRAERTATVLTDLFGSADPFAPVRGDTLRAGQLLAAGADRVNRELRAEPAVRANLLLAIGRSLRSLGRYDESQHALDTARALRDGDPHTSASDRAEVLAELGHLAREREQFANAQALYAASLREREESSANNTLRAPVAPGTSVGAGSDAPTVSTAAHDAERGALAASLANVGSGYLGRNRFDSAQVLFDSALVVIRTVARPDTARLADLLNNRATLAIRTGDFATAHAMAREAYDLNVARLGPDHPRVAAELGNIGFLLDRLGRSVEAEPMLRESLRILRERLPADHPNVRTAMLNMGGVWGRTGKFDDAEGIIRDVVALDRARGNDGRMQLTITLDNLAGVLERQGRNADMEATYREAWEIRRAVAGEEDPGTAILLGKLADATCRTGDDRGALPDFERSLGILDRAFPPDHGFRVGARGNYGSCLLRAGRREEGERELVAMFDAARRGPGATHAMARLFGKELLALYAAPADSLRRAAVQAGLDSLGPTPLPRS
jgi:serine/threonine-protein kinase